MHNITSIGSELWIYDNAILVNIEGLENINPESIFDLHIYNNPMLSECDIISICEYLAAPNGTVEIHDNAPGCNDSTQILSACFPLVKEIKFSEGFTITPNPFESTIIISYLLKQNSKVSLQIHDISGRPIRTLVNEEQQSGKQTVIYNTEGLRQGVYFCRLFINGNAETKKLIRLE